MRPLVQLFLCFLLKAASGIDTDKLGETIPCTCDKQQQHDHKCEIDGYVGSSLIYEDNLVRVWNFTLAPGEMTSMHRHDHDYHFVAIKPSQLEVYGEDGSRLFDFRAEGVLGFRMNGEMLEPIGIELPWDVPRVHAAKNIGEDYYYEILFESKRGALPGEYLDAVKSEMVREEVIDEL